MESFKGNYIWEKASWPKFNWNQVPVATITEQVLFKQGLLLGRMKGMGADVHAAGTLESLENEIIASSAIEGEHLCSFDVRSSVARKLGLNNVILSGLGQDQLDAAPDKGRDPSVVEVHIDAVQNSNAPLTEKRLFDWHRMIFPESISYGFRINAGCYRTDRKGRMQVVSGPIGKETVHYLAPPASIVPFLMDGFIKWFNQDARSQGLNAILKSAITHLYFVSIHPFEDGNGRISRALADMTLRKGSGCSVNDHLFSMSSQLLKERKEYYAQLEKAQISEGDDIDITSWLLWYIECMGSAIDSVLDELDCVEERKLFWREVNQLGISSRQRKVLGLLIANELEGKLSSSRWARICKCSQDTAARDIIELVSLGILAKSESGGRSTAYFLVHKKLKA